MKWGRVAEPFAPSALGQLGVEPFAEAKGENSRLMITCFINLVNNRYSTSIWQMDTFFRMVAQREENKGVELTGGQCKSQLATECGGRGRWRAGSLLRAIVRLRVGVRVIQEESYDFLEEYIADVHGAVDTIAGLRSVQFANRDLPRQSFSRVMELDVEQIPV